VSIGTDDEQAHRFVDQARRTAQENLGEARRFVHALAPADLDGATLVAALRRVADRAQDTADGLHVRVEVSGGRRRLPVALEAALVRVAQSALANVVQHSGAAHAAVTVTYQDDEVILDVVDDGCGFVPGPQADRAQARGFGLAAMGSRIREIGGTLTVESAPGEGTAVAVRLPVDDAPPVDDLQETP
jgi:signal transduction histidine kinase